MKAQRSACVLALLCGVWTAAAGQAQPVPPIPGTVQPGQIERQFQTLPDPKARSDEIVVPIPSQGAPVNAEGVRFGVRAIVVEGVSVYREETLVPLYAQYLGREVSLLDMYKVANALTIKYRNDGYILSQVIVPAQEVRDGTIRLQAVEGYVHEVRIGGEIEGRRDLVEACAAKIQRARPLTAAVLERYLLLMNDFAGATARATLNSSERPGASDLFIDFAHRTVAASVTLDNRGSRSIGPLRLTTELDLNSVLGRYERTNLRLGTTGNKELIYAALAHEYLVGSEGGKLSFSASVVRSEPELAGEVPLNLETSSEAASVGYSYPLTRSRAQNLNVRGALTAHNGQTDINNLRNSEDRIRALRVGLTYDRADSLRGINLLDVELAQGINALGARKSGTQDVPLSRVTGRSDFTKLTAYGARLQSIASRWSVLAAVNAQYAFSDLLASELFGFGGEQFGRGYDPSEIVGDSGAAAKVELRYTDSAAGQLPIGYTAYGFYDVGTVRRRTPANESGAESAASAGMGLRFSLGRYVTGFFELAKPLTRVVSAEGNQDLRGYVGLSVRY